MPITDPLVLPSDVLIFPVSQLNDEARKAAACRDSDFAITRPRARVASRILDADAADLVKRFTSAATIVEAVIQFSRERRLDAERTLEECFPLLQDLINCRFLVPVGSDEADAIEPLLTDGDEIAGFRIGPCVHIADDTEVYQAAGPDGPVAFKITRPGCPPATEQLLLREAAILNALQGAVAPALYQTGRHDGRLFVAMEWCRGVPVTTAAQEFRDRRDPDSARELASICTAVLNAFATLHAAGVVHGDVHPMNVLIDAAGAARVIDFGFARMPGVEPIPGFSRGGVAFFLEPEYAQPSRAGLPPPPATPLGEQYAVAALLYFLLTGAYCVEFSLERARMLAQIADDPPLPLHERGAPGWPHVQQVLWRALEKDPDRRYPTTADFAESFAHAAEADLTAAAAHTTPSAPQPHPGRASPDAYEQFFHHLADDDAFRSEQLTAPTASANFGAAGIAYALYRLAGIRQSAPLLTAADRWLARARAEALRPEGFTNEALEVTPDLAGPVSPYHTASGIHLVQALVCNALGDLHGRVNAIAAFAAASAAPCDGLDLTLGRLSTVIACSILLDAIGNTDGPEQQTLKSLASDRLATVWAHINELPPIRECAEQRYLGVAHGWGGFLYAALLWNRCSGSSLPTGAEERLNQLAELAEPTGRGVRWQWTYRAANRAGSHAYMPGWCNGTAGMVFLWTAAHRALGDPRFLDLAERSAFNTWETPSGPASLCCGYAGQAYALLNLYRHTDRAIWLRRAQALARQAIAVPDTPETPPQSLYKGKLGVALLQADIAAPAHAHMPLFECESGS